MTQMMANEQRLDFNDMKDKLAKHMMASKVENNRKQAEVYRICEQSDQLKALKAQIHAAYLNKERAAQVAENQFRSQRGLEEETEFERDQLIRKEREQRLEKERQRMARESAVHNKNNLQNQMLEKEKLKVEAYQEYLKEKQQVDRVVQALIAEDQEQDTLIYQLMQFRTAHQLQLKKEQAQADMMQSLYEKQMQQKRMKQMNQEQEERVRKYAELQEERLNQILGQRAKAAAQKEEILNKLAAEEERRRAEQEYIENLRIELNQQEAQERERERERQQRERREQVRLELLQSKKLQEEIKLQRIEQEKALEQNFRVKMMQKFAQDDRIDQMNAQKRRMKELEHKREVERLWNEKLELYRWQREQQITQKRIKDEQERQKQQVIEMEKQRLLEEHAELLKNYHPKAAGNHYLV